MAAPRARVSPRLPPSTHRAAPHLRAHSRLGHNKAEAEGVHVGVVVLVERVGRLCVVIYLEVISRGDHRATWEEHPHKKRPRDFDEDDNDNAPTA